MQTGTHHRKIWGIMGNGEVGLDGGLTLSEGYRLWRLAHGAGTERPPDGAGPPVYPSPSLEVRGLHPMGNALTD